MIETVVAVEDRRWARLSYAYALLVAAVLAYFVLGLPIQRYDGFSNMLALEGGSLWDLMRGQFYQRSYLRPLLWVQLKAVYDVADGQYYWWFRGLHAVQACVLIALFVRLLRPRTPLDAALVPVGLAMLVGIHTFPGTVREAFPINTFMTILLCCVMAANLVLARPGWRVDAGLAALFVFGSLTVESGLLVWVIVASGWIGGARGVSVRGLAVTTALLGGYFVLRLGVLDVGSPALIERSSGFWFAILEPSELEQRFGANRAAFYAYNVVTSALSVLFAEPRSGVWMLTRSVVDGEPRWPLLINAVASTTATLVILGYAWRRRREWLARRFERDDQIVLIFLGVLAANSVISYPYTKDTIMSPAGLFYAAAAVVALRAAVKGLSRGRAARAAAVAVSVVLAVTWTIRETGTLVALRHQVFNVRTDWAYAGEPGDDGARAATAATRAVEERLRRDAIARYPKSSPAGAWVEIFDMETR